MSISYLEANARERMVQLLDAGSFEEFLPPAQRVVSPHLGQLDAPVAFDDGVVVGSGTLQGAPVFAAAQEGGFMGGAVGEVHGAKLVGLLLNGALEQADQFGAVHFTDRTTHETALLRCCKHLGAVERTASDHNAVVKRHRRIELPQMRADDAFRRRQEFFKTVGVEHLRDAFTGIRFQVTGCLR